MARYSATYSGDTSSWFAGKIMSAAGMARAESDAQEKDRQAGLNVANSGNIFAKALQSEFGGDLFSRTIGIFDTNRSAAQTDRASSKARRFAANFPRTERKENEDVKKSSEAVDRAVDDLLKKDDDSLPVKDEKLREYVTRVFGVGIDSKLTQVDQRISKSVNILSDVRRVQQGSVDLMIDHNEVVAGKLDQLLKLYNEQYNFQNVLKDRAQVARKENELEKERNLASTRRYMGLPTGDMGGAIFGGLSDFIGKKLWNNIADKLGLKSIGSKVKRVGTPIAEKASENAITKIARNFARQHGYQWKDAGKLFGATERKLTKKYVKPLLDKVTVELLSETTSMLDDMGFPDASENVEKTMRQFELDAAEKVSTRKATNALTKKTSRVITKEIVKDAVHSSALQELVNKGLVDPKTIRAMKGVSTIAPQVGIKPYRKPLTAISRRGVKQPWYKKGLMKGAAKIQKTLKASKAFLKGTKLIPGIGTTIALGEAAYRASQGDMTGAALSLLSAVPVVGWGVTAIDIGRDIGINPLGLPPPPAQRNQGYGFDYEGGTKGLTTKGLAKLHGTERLMAVDPNSGITTSHIKNIGDTLVSSAMHMANDLGVSREIHNKVSTLPFAVKNISYNSGIKTGPVKSKTMDTSVVQQDMGLAAWMEAEIARTTPNEEDTDKRKKARWWKPWTWGQGGSGGPNVSANQALVGKDPKRITFGPGQGRDESGEPGIDFSYGDKTKNFALFDGEVVKTGFQSKGYGNVVIVRSTDPSNGRQFDALYAHFPDGGIAVSVGQKIKGGDYLGKVGFVSAPSGTPEYQPNGAGRMSGWHTSVDFFEPDSTAAYHNGKSIIDILMGSAGVAPRGNNILGPLDGDAFTKEMIKSHEGRRLDAYYDEKGNLTVGYGHKIDASSPADIQALKEGDVITAERAEELFNDDYDYHKSMAEKLPGYDLATERQKAALIDLVFNMGPYFLDEFPAMGKALEKGDFEEAARQLQFSDPDNRPGVESDWMGDVKEKRSTPILQLLKNQPVDGDVSPHLKKFEHLQPQAKGMPDVMPIFDRLAQNNKLEEGSNAFEDMTDKNQSGVIVVLNNIVQQQNLATKGTDTYVKTSGLTPSVFKMAKLAG